MQYDPIDYEAIQQRVIHRVQRRYRFIFHSAIFALGIPVIGSWSSAEIFMIWVGAWVMHMLWVNYQNHLEKAIEQEIDRERERIIKRKREYAEMTERYQFDPYEEEDTDWLGDDGEFVEEQERRRSH
jgi:hypothetical protein